MTAEPETITYNTESTPGCGTRRNRNASTSPACYPRDLRRLADAHTTARSFDEVVLPHLDAARRLARRLLRNDADAEDAVQEASLRALRYFRTFAGGDGRAWFLRIVRNACSASRDHRVDALTDEFNEEHHVEVGGPADPEVLLLRIDDATVITRAMGTLPPRVRRLLELRELQGLSYRELAYAMAMPMGTVMSSLSRARQALRAALRCELRQSSTADNRAAGQPE
jgi:RNA polymerase sigma-70 factor (ECF subfamily)